MNPASFHSKLHKAHRCIDQLPIDILSKQQALIDDFLGNEKVWRLSTFDDPFVRRAVYRLLHTSVSKMTASLNWNIISNNVLVSSLHISQAGSAPDFVKALARLTTVIPEIWTQHYGGSEKKSANKRLCQFLRKGSQGGAVEYWAETLNLLYHIPSEVLVPASKTSDGNADDNYATVDAFRQGIVTKEEPRSNQSAAWKAYLEYSRNRLQPILGIVKRDDFIKHAITPLLHQYVKPTMESATWSLPSTQAKTICIKAVQHVLESREVFTAVWLQMSANIVRDLQILQPEQSKTYTESQSKLVAEATRWYNLHSAFRVEDMPEYALSLVAKTIVSELGAAVITLSTRDGKPYAAARLIEIAVCSASQIIQQDEGIKKLIVSFAQDDIPQLFLSPSAPYLIELLQHLKDLLDVDAIYEAALKILLATPESANKYGAMRSLLASPYLARLTIDQQLQATINSTLKQALTGVEERWDLLDTALKNRHAPASLHSQILVAMVEGLSIEDRKIGSLDGLEMVTKHDPTSIKLYNASSEHPLLLSKLLSLIESPDATVSGKAKRIKSVLESTAVTESSLGQASGTLIEIIKRALSVANVDSLSIPSVVDLARKLLDQAAVADQETLAIDLLPSASQWIQALKPHLSRPPNPSLAIVCSMSSDFHIFDIGDCDQPIARDSNGFSTALRMAWYCADLIAATDLFGYVTNDYRTTTLEYLTILLQLASDEIGLAVSDSLWIADDLDSESELVEFVANTQKLVASWLESDSIPNFVSATEARLLEGSKGSLVSSYYKSRAYVTLKLELNELYASRKQLLGNDQLKEIKKSPDLFTAIAVVSTVQDYDTLTRLCNELIADLTGCDFSKQSEGLQYMMLLNCILNRTELGDIVTKIPQQRLMFFVQHILAHALNAISLKDTIHDASVVTGSPVTTISTEVLRTLQMALPPLTQLYGSIWSDTISLIIDCWRRSEEPIPDELLPLVHAGLRLFSKLRNLKDEDSNDDLQDAWSESIKKLAGEMLDLLRGFAGAYIVFLHHHHLLALSNLLTDHA